MGSFKGHALPGSFFLVAGIWWTGKHSLWHATRRNKNIGSSRLASRASQRRLEIIESAAILFFSLLGRWISLSAKRERDKRPLMKMSVSSAGMLAEQFAADGPKLRLYDSAENQWKDLMNWQHSTMYLFFGLAGTVSLIIHCTEAAPLALDRLMIAVAFFNEGERCSLHSDHL